MLYCCQIAFTCYKDFVFSVVVHMLKHGAEPGGYLQWRDIDIDAQHLARVSDLQTRTKPTEDMMELMSKPRDSDNFK